MNCLQFFTGIKDHVVNTFEYILRKKLVPTSEILLQEQKLSLEIQAYLNTEIANGDNTTSFEIKLRPVQLFRHRSGFQSNNHKQIKEFNDCNLSQLNILFTAAINRFLTLSSVGYFKDPTILNHFNFYCDKCLTDGLYANEYFTESQQIALNKFFNPISLHGCGYDSLSSLDCFHIIHEFQNIHKNQTGFGSWKTSQMGVVELNENTTMLRNAYINECQGVINITPGVNMVDVLEAALLLHNHTQKFIIPFKFQPAIQYNCIETLEWFSNIFERKFNGLYLIQQIVPQFDDIHQNLLYTAVKLGHLDVVKWGLKMPTILGGPLKIKHWHINNATIHDQDHILEWASKLSPPILPTETNIVMAETYGNTRVRKWVNNYLSNPNNSIEDGDF
ncbi:MAG: hypothetical protein JKX76_01805 [Colwellia sp.]|nr:hypothetical protein [Colwellia sp.]